jgi:hypothetical protein
VFQNSVNMTRPPGELKQQVSSTLLVSWQLKGASIGQLLETGGTTWASAGLASKKPLATATNERVNIVIDF